MRMAARNNGGDAMNATTLDPNVDLILAERPHLKRMALSLTRHDADADDLVQETVFRAFRARERLRPGSCMRAWLSTILRRTFLSSVKQRTRRPVRPWTDAGLTVDQVEGEMPAARVVCEGTDLESVEEQLSDSMRRAVRQVPEVYREPFFRYALLGLTYGEIARQLGVPNGTVMSRIHRARIRLRDTFAKPSACVAGGAR
jgi:RNA polymerase sigma-70 factor (ECF subfamily)